MGVAALRPLPPAGSAWSNPGIGQEREMRQRGARTALSEIFIVIIHPCAKEPWRSPPTHQSASPLQPRLFPGSGRVPATQAAGQQTLQTAPAHWVSCAEVSAQPLLSREGGQTDLRGSRRGNIRSRAAPRGGSSEGRWG